jgi:hypothetical protein
MRNDLGEAQAAVVVGVDATVGHLPIKEPPKLIVRSVAVAVNAKNQY